jgi:hypothetical protein
MLRVLPRPSYCSAPLSSASPTIPAAAPSAPAVRDIRKVITTTAANPGIAQLAQRVAQVL